MASNSFGTIFKMITWGESHGKAIGVIVDGCPAGLPLTVEDIQKELDRRSPGNNSFTSPRKEADRAEILSGVFEGYTTGTPISILIPNQDQDSSKYDELKDLFRPGHANFTYLEKYGIYDYRGGGRSSGRETACRVAAGAIAKKLIAHFGIQVVAYLKQIGFIEATIPSSLPKIEGPLFCPDPEAAEKMMTMIDMAKSDGDSLGGVVEFQAQGVPAGLGDPLYEKIEAKLAAAMMGLPATKAFQMGTGIDAALMKGSEHNDLFMSDEDKVVTKTNHSGGTLGGISNGMPIIGRVTFKPPSSIMKIQSTLSIEGIPFEMKLPEGSRHDPCVAIRGVPVVEAMVALVLADLLLLNRVARL